MLLQESVLWGKPLPQSLSVSGGSLLQLRCRECVSYAGDGAIQPFLGPLRLHADQDEQLFAVLCLCVHRPRSGGHPLCTGMRMVSAILLFILFPRFFIIKCVYT